MLGNGDGYFDPDYITTYGYYVAIRKFDVNETIEHNGIFIPNSASDGFKAVRGEVISIGEDAVEKYGVNVGDVVSYDQCSVKYDTIPVVIIHAENLVFKIKNDKPYPLKDIVFAKKVSSLLEVDNTQGILIPDKNTDASIGEVIAVDNDKVVSIGDHILLTTMADVLKGPEGRIYAYHQDNILCKIEFASSQ